MHGIIIGVILIIDVTTIGVLVRAQSTRPLRSRVSGSDVHAAIERSRRARDVCAHARKRIPGVPLARAAIAARRGAEALNGAHCWSNPIA